MIGPRPTKGSVLPRRPGLASGGGAARGAGKAEAKAKRAASPQSGSEEGGGGGKRKRLASDDGGSSSEAPPAKEVPLHEVESLSQMARLAPGLKAKLAKGELRSREMCTLVRVAAKTKFFDGELFEELFKELPDALRRKRLSTDETVEVICSLSGLNAYNARVFDEACASMQSSVASFSSVARERIRAALAAVRHDAGAAFMGELKGKKATDNRPLCELFVRGQCKMGPKCKLSHDESDEKFEDAIKSWKGIGGQDKRSQGFKQSSDLFKADRCGALW